MRSRSFAVVVALCVARAAVVPLATLLLLLASAPVFAAPPVSSVSDNIICMCGCKSVLSQCPHQECGWGVPAKQFIAEQLDGGKTPGELIQYYVTQFGEEILAAPTKKGFNLAAWATPFAALAVGAVAVYYLAGSWSKRRRVDADSETPVSDEPQGAAPEELTRRLEDELKRFD